MYKRKKHMTEATETPLSIKVCISCKQILPLIEFQKSSRYKSGVESLCKNCRRVYQMTQGKKKVQCPCGAIVKSYSLYDHRKSQKHKMYIALVEKLTGVKLPLNLSVIHC